MAVTLDNLAPELLEQIGESFTSAAQWSAFRLSCRTVRSATHRAWAKAFFSSLAVPLDFAEHSAFISTLNLPDFCLLASEVVFYCADEDSLRTKDWLWLLEYAHGLMVLLQKLKRATYFRFTNAQNAATRYSSGGMRVSNCSTCFDMVLCAAGLAGLRLKHVYCHPNDPLRERVGIYDYSGFARLKQHFPDLESFCGDLMLRSGNRETNANSAKLARQLSESFNYMRSLKSLDLEFGWTTEAQEVLHYLAKSIFLPNLEHLVFGGARCSTTNMVELVHRHRATLKALCLITALFDTTGPPEFHELLEEVRDHLLLDRLMLDDPYYSRSKIVFRGLSEVGIDVDFENENEDGFVEIFVMEGARLDTRDEVHQYVPRMISAIAYEELDDDT